MPTIRPVAAAIGFAIVLDGAGGIREALELGVAPWPELPEPALIVLDAGDARTAVWLADNAAFAPAFSARGRGDVDALDEIRRTAAVLRRRVSGLHAAIVAITELEGTDLFDAYGDRWRALLRQSDELIDLMDGAVERQEAVDDHLQNQISTELADRLYVLTLVSAVLLPLSFFTGLLGVNVGGIPLRDSPWAFWILCGFLIVLAMAQYLLVKKLRWLPRQDLRLRRRRSP